MSPRSYHSKVRTEAARATRTAIIEAARALFVEHGYARTSVSAIADRAGVALNTVYISVGGKSALIAAITDDAAEDPVTESALATIARATDGDEILRVTASSTAEVTRRHADVLRMLVETRAAEPVVETTMAAAIDLYRERLTGIADRLHTIGCLRPGLDVERAAQILWFYFGAAAWSTVRELGWGWTDAADWLHSQAATALFTRR